MWPRTVLMLRGAKEHDDPCTESSCRGMQHHVQHGRSYLHARREGREIFRLRCGLRARSLLGLCEKYTMHHKHALLLVGSPEPREHRRSLVVAFLSGVVKRSHAYHHQKQGMARMVKLVHTLWHRAAGEAYHLHREIGVSPRVPLTPCKYLGGSRRRTSVTVWSSSHRYLQSVT